MEQSFMQDFLHKAQFYLDRSFSYVNLTTKQVILYVTCFGIGFLFGMLFKHYGKWFVSVALALVLVFLGLQYFQLISVHHANVKLLLGLQDYHSWAQVAELLQQKMYEFWIELVLFVIAALVGFKLG